MSLQRWIRIGAVVAVLSLGAWPVRAALTWQLSTIDSAGSVGQHTSIALDGSGNPVISYYDSANGDLKLVHCGDTTCITGNSIQTVDSVGNVGQFTSLKLDANGFPVISYYDVTNADLKLVHCGNADCSSGNSIQTVDSAGAVGRFTSLALDSNDRPVISYSGAGLKVVRCGDVNCSSGNIIQTLDGAGSLTSIALDGSGRPVVSYFVPVPPSIGNLKLVRCGDANCSAGNIIQTLDSTIGVLGSNTALALDRMSGAPVIAYYDSVNADLKLMRCGDPTCAAGNVSQIVDSAGTVGQFASMALGSSGNPVISYLDGSRLDLKVALCGDATCTSNNTITTVDSPVSTGQYTSLALDGDGNPVVGYFNPTFADLKLARLGIDVTPPSVRINQSIEDPTFSRTIRFAALFSEPVTGLTDDGVIVGGSAGATAARISSSNPNRTLFSIEVTGMTSSGTVTASIRANAALDAAGLGNTSSTSTDNTVTYILDNTPPTCVVTVTPATLWPPNHRMVDVVTAVSVTDTGSGPNGAYLYSVTSSEAEGGLGDDDVVGDIQWFDSYSPTIQLRSERFATQGRTYTITYRAGDVVGNISSCSTTVRVPLGQN